MSIQPELKTILKRLKLSGMLATLPDRVAYARKEKLDYGQFLELVLSDEVERRDQKHVTNRLTAAGFEEECTLERFDWSAKIRIDKARLTDLFGLHFIERRENVILCGPVGVGKSFLGPGSRSRRLPRQLPRSVHQSRPPAKDPGPLSCRQLLRS